MLRALGFGAAGLGVLYAGSNCLFNVEGGHRAILFNRIGGFKDEVRRGGVWRAVAPPPPARDRAAGRAGAAARGREGRTPHVDLTAAARRRTKRART